MILRNKTNGMAHVELVSGRTVYARPYRTITLDEKIYDYNPKQWEEIKQVVQETESDEKKVKNKTVKKSIGDK